MPTVQLGPSLEGTRQAPFWYPDFRIILLAATFPSDPRTVVIRAAFVIGYSGGAVPDFHRLPNIEPRTMSRIDKAGGTVKGAEGNAEGTSSTGTGRGKRSSEPRGLSPRMGCAQRPATATSLVFRSFVHVCRARNFLPLRRSEDPRVANDGVLVTIEVGWGLADDRFFCPPQGLDLCVGLLQAIRFPFLPRAVNVVERLDPPIGQPQLATPKAVCPCPPDQAFRLCHGGVEAVYRGSPVTLPINGDFPCQIPANG